MQQCAFSKRNMSFKLAVTHHCCLVMVMHISIGFPTCPRQFSLKAMKWETIQIRICDLSPYHLFLDCHFITIIVQWSSWIADKFTELSLAQNGRQTRQHFNTLQATSVGNQRIVQNVPPVLRGPRMFHLRFPFLQRGMNSDITETFFKPLRFANTGFMRNSENPKLE